MESIIEFLSQPVWQRLGMTLVHFLWQGLAIATLLGAFVWIFKPNHGQARYTVYLLAFIAMIVCPAVTFIAIDAAESPDVEFVTEAESVKPFDITPETVLPGGDTPTQHDTSGSVMSISTAEANSIPLYERIYDYLHISMPWFIVIWMVGVIILSVRLLTGFVGLYRWRRHLRPLPERLIRRIARVSQRLGMRGFSRVFISPSALEAMAIGYLRPMVLLPAAMLMQMQPEMLEAVIAHELAHIRRFDLWVNLLQRIVETLLFYHPAVWWLSNSLRSEREHCCDELAIVATGQRLAYATVLGSIGRARLMSKEPVLAAGLGQNKKPTLSRVRHILGLAPAQRNCPFWLAGVIAVLFLAFLIIPTTLALTFQTGEENNVEAEVTLVLSPEAEEFIQSLNLTGPDVIRDFRTAFQTFDKITSDQAWNIVNKLMTDNRPEVKRAAVNLLASENVVVRLFVIRHLSEAGENTEYFLTKILEFWDDIGYKEKRQLQRSLPIVLKSNKGNAVVEDLVDEIVALMISNSGKTVPLAGIELVKKMDLESDRINAALFGQTENPIYDYFSNEHPVRKAALELLGEEYTPPPHEEVDYSQISVAEEMQLERSPDLTVGILTSLYTATGPCISNGDNYGWYPQCCLFPVLEHIGIDAYAYFHPITQVEDSSFFEESCYSGESDTILNAACSYDLSMCDVIVLINIRNIREEVIDALEDFVWNGGAIVTLDGTGIVSCLAPKKFAALQDMRNLRWDWKALADQNLVQLTETSLTRDINLSLPVEIPGRTFERNGYTFNSSKYNGQILLRFEPDGAVALRVSTYGAGRIAHFGWIPRFGLSPDDEIGKRNWQLVHRVLLWAAGQEYEDLRPEPAYSKERYQDNKGIVGRIIDALK